jgi:aconitate hydratase
MDSSIDRSIFQEEYGRIFESNEAWNAIEGSGGQLFSWDDASTYIQEPPFFVGLGMEEPEVESIQGARVLVLLGDSVTTDHISPAGAIPPESPAADYLRSHGVEQRDFNSYGSRRGNHQVMMRGTFGNIRLRNQLAPETEGGWTTHLGSGEVMSIFDASMRYQDEGRSLIVLAGTEYGTGSSRDWAAKGTFLLGVKAVIATSYERIHRSNLVGMGVLPLQFEEGQSWKSLGLTGQEYFDLELPQEVAPGQSLTVRAGQGNGEAREFQVQVRLDTPVEVRYWKNGGILHTVLRDMARA